MALNPSNIIASRTGTTSETIFHIYLYTNLPYTLVKRQVKDYLFGKY